MHFGATENKQEISEYYIIWIHQFNAKNSLNIYRAFLLHDTSMRK